MNSGIKLYDSDEAQAEISSSSAIGRSRQIWLTVYCENAKIGEILENSLAAWLLTHDFQLRKSI
jgi:hypothetical protein